MRKLDGTVIHVITVFHADPALGHVAVYGRLVMDLLHLIIHTKREMAQMAIQL